MPLGATPPSDPPRREEPFDDRLVKALAHPLRMRILEVLNRRVSSPAEIAAELGAKLGDVGYHVRMLRDYGAVELVRTERHRGAVKHLYRATTRAMLDDDQWARVPLSVRRTIFGEVLQRIAADVARAGERGGFDRTDAHVSFTNLELDDRGYRDLTELVGATLDRALEIQAEVVQRRVEGPVEGDEVRTELVLLHFLDGR